MSKKFYEAKVLPALGPILDRYDMSYPLARQVYRWAYSEKQARFILEHEFPGCEIIELGPSTYERHKE